MHSEPLAPPTRVLARAFHPMFALYAGVLAGAALIFDLLYLMVGGGVLMAVLYTLPVTAGLVACLVAAADELKLDRRAVRAAVQLAVGAGLTNALYLGAVNTMRATTPASWFTGAFAVLLSAAAVLSAAVTVLQAIRLCTLATPVGTAPTPPPAAPAVTYVERVNPSLAALVNDPLPAYRGTAPVDRTLVDPLPAYRGTAPDTTLVDPTGKTLVLPTQEPAAA